MMRIAVTGAGGFLGTYLMQVLARELSGAEVTGVVRREPAMPVDGVRYTSELSTADLVFHLAGSKGLAASLEDPHTDLEANAAGTLEVLDWVRGGGASTLILTSSSAVYGHLEGAAQEDRLLRPISPYGVSKLAAESYVYAYHHLHGVDGRIARISNVYGPGQRSLVIYELARRALTQGAPLRVRGDGRQTRDFIHAEDVARALLAIGLNGEPGGIYNVGSGEPISIAKVAGYVAAAAGLPADGVVLDGQVEAGKVSTFYPVVERLTSLGFRPIRLFAEGIAETVEWVRARPG